MIGRNQIQLGAEQLMSGMSSSDFATDGALGVESYGLNPFSVPGALYALATPANISTNVVDNIIASCEDSQSVTALNRTMIGDGANFYTYNGSAITKVHTGTGTYQAGATDMVAFAGNTYISQTTDITKWNTSAATYNEVFWTSTLSKSFGSTIHPLLVYFNHLYIADGNLIHSLKSDGSTVDTDLPALPLTLNTNDIITALGIDPASGLMMISIQTAVNKSDTLSSKYYVGLWDGASAYLYRRIPVNDLVTAFYNVEGTVYVGCGNTLGQWNGNGVTFLRTLKNAGLSSTDLPYKHHFANINRVLHVIDGPVVLSYGAVIAGKKAFFYTAFEQDNTPPSNHLTCLFPAGSSGGGERLGISYYTGSTYKCCTFDFASTSSGSAQLYFNNIYFPRPIFVRRAKIITSGITTNSGVGGFSIKTEFNSQTEVRAFNVLAAASPRYVFDQDFTILKCMGIQPILPFSGQGYGIIRIYIYYDVAE